MVPGPIEIVPMFPNIVMILPSLPPDMVDPVSDFDISTQFLSSTEFLTFTLPGGDSCPRGNFYKFIRHPWFKENFSFAIHGHQESNGEF